jgi:hypothetical protein
MTEEALFAHLEKLQGREPWGRFLDAGTGRHSLAWVAGLATARWTAVTADPARAAALEREFAARMRPGDRIARGDWTDPAFLHGEVHDTVLADYLIGAVDAVAPYFQDLLLERLRRHVGARLYVVGLEPYREDDRSPAGRVVREIAGLRDACILLAGHRAHREFPLEWTLRQLARAGYTVEDAASFPIIYGERFVNEQLEVCRRKLPLLDDRDLARALETRIEAVRDRALAICAAHRGLRFGEDYVILARPAAAPRSP